MAPGNLTGLQGSNNFVDIIQFVNYNTGGVFGVSVIMAFFFITLFISMRRNTFEEALLVAAFVGFGMSIWMRVLQFVGYQWMIYFVIIMFFDGYYLYKTKNWSLL